MLTFKVFSLPPTDRFDVKLVFSLGIAQTILPADNSPISYTNYAKNGVFRYMYIIVARFNNFDLFLSIQKSDFRRSYIRYQIGHDTKIFRFLSL